VTNVAEKKARQECVVWGGSGESDEHSASEGSNMRVPFEKKERRGTVTPRASGKLRTPQSSEHQLVSKLERKGWSPSCPRVPGPRELLRRRKKD